MTTELPGDCFNCKNHIRGDKCMAFPDGIPQDIFTGETKHTKPYSGDGGIRFEPIIADGDDDISKARNPRFPCPQGQHRHPPDKYDYCHPIERRHRDMGGSTGDPRLDSEMGITPTEQSPTNSTTATKQHVIPEAYHTLSPDKFFGHNNEYGIESEDIPELWERARSNIYERVGISAVISLTWDEVVEKTNSKNTVANNNRTLINFIFQLAENSANRHKNKEVCMKQIVEELLVAHEKMIDPIDFKNLEIDFRKSRLTRVTPLSVSELRGIYERYSHWGSVDYNLVADHLVRNHETFEHYGIDITKKLIEDTPLKEVSRYSRYVASPHDLVYGNEGVEFDMFLKFSNMGIPPGVVFDIFPLENSKYLPISEYEEGYGGDLGIEIISGMVSENTVGKYLRKILEGRAPQDLIDEFGRRNNHIFEEGTPPKIAAAKMKEFFFEREAYVSQAINRERSNKYGMSDDISKAKKNCEAGYHRHPPDKYDYCHPVTRRHRDLGGSTGDPRIDEKLNDGLGLENQGTRQPGQSENQTNTVKQTKGLIKTVSSFLESIHESHVHRLRFHGDVNAYLERGFRGMKKEHKNLKDLESELMLQEPNIRSLLGDGAQEHIDNVRRFATKGIMFKMLFNIREVRDALISLENAEDLADQEVEYTGSGVQKAIDSLLEAVERANDDVGHKYLKANGIEYNAPKLENLDKMAPALREAATDLVLVLENNDWDTSYKNQTRIIERLETLDNITDDEVLSAIFGYLYFSTKNSDFSYEPEDYKKLSKAWEVAHAYRILRERRPEDGELAVRNSLIGDLAWKRITPEFTIYDFLDEINDRSEGGFTNVNNSNRWPMLINSIEGLEEELPCSNFIGLHDLPVEVAEEILNTLYEIKQSISLDEVGDFTSDDMLGGRTSDIRDISVNMIHDAYNSSTGGMYLQLDFRGAPIKSIFLNGYHFENQGVNGREAFYIGNNSGHGIRHTILHEFGHAFAHRTLGTMWAARTPPVTRNMLKESAETIMGDYSGVLFMRNPLFGEASPAEFIAEAFSMMVRGKKLPEHLQELYTEAGGFWPDGEAMP